MTYFGPPIQVVTALATTGYVGKAVIVSSNGHLYNWDGATWIDNGSAGGGGGGGAGIALGAGTQTATTNKVVLSNSNGLTWGMSGSSRITASFDAIRSASAGTTHVLGPGISLGDANGLSFGANGSTVTASYTVPSTAGLLSAINLSAGTTSQNLSAFVVSNGGGLSFGLNGSTLTGSVAAGATATGNLGGLAAGTQTATGGTVAFANSNGLTWGMSNSTQITASYTVPSTAGLLSAINLSAGTTSNNASAFVFSNGGNVSFGLNGSTITASAPSGGGGGGTTLSTYEPYPFVANTGTSALSLSSNTSAAMMLFPFDLHAPVAAEVLGVAISASFVTGGASSFRQSGTLHWGLYTRPTGTNSTVLSSVGSSSLSYAVTYNNSTITLSHHTTTNYAADYGYGSTTSAGLSITSGYTGLKLYNLNLGSTLTPGRYWLGVHHRNSSSSFNSGLRLSVYGAAVSLTGFAPLGSFSSAHSTGTNVPLGLGGNFALGLGSYSLAALTSLPATITMSQITQAGVNLRPYMRLSTRVTA